MDTEMINDKVSQEILFISTEKYDATQVTYIYLNMSGKPCL